MKISVFCDYYRPFDENKDSGQIPLGLLDIGADSGVYTITKPELQNYMPPFNFTQATLKEYYTSEFWAKQDSEFIFLYPVSGKTYVPLIEKMKAGGKKIILKLDSDGKIAYPLQRNYFRVPLKERLSVRQVAGDLFWRFASKSLKRKRHADFAFDFIRRCELSDFVVIESPDALTNLNYYLIAWGRADLIRKTVFVPDPAGPEFNGGKIDNKEKIIVAYGRWDDYSQKNTRLMVDTTVQFLKQRGDYHFVIFGKGSELVESFLKKAPDNVRKRIKLLGYIKRPEIKRYLSSARTFFVPSRWESFSISSGEALCMGCSIVGTPMEPLRYLTMQGFSGTTSASFDETAVLAALLQDADKWDNGGYDSEATAVFWREKLNRKTIAAQILKKAEKFG